MPITRMYVSMARSEETSSASVSTNMRALSTWARMIASSPRAWANRMRRSAAALSLRGKIDSGKSFDNIGVRLTLLPLVLVFERRHDLRVRQRRRVSERTPFRDITQEPAHDLARPRLWQVRRKQHIVRPRDRADLLRYKVPQLVPEFR